MRWPWSQKTETMDSRAEPSEVAMDVLREAEGALTSAQTVRKWVADPLSVRLRREVEADHFAEMYARALKKGA